jgi:hypothetical protein
VQDHKAVAAASLTENPKLYPKVHQSFGRAWMKKYAYDIYYTTKEDLRAVLDLAVWDVRQNPDKIKDRLK